MYVYKPSPVLLILLWFWGNPLKGCGKVVYSCYSRCEQEKGRGNVRGFVASSAR
jgi:hypothetical protein